MKFSLPTILLTLTTLTLLTMTVRTAGLRGRALQSINVEGSNLSAPNIKISGVSTLLQILNSASAFTNATFDVITIDSFSQSTTDQGLTYEANVTLVNDQGVNITGHISGAWDPVSNKVEFNVAKLPVATEDTEESDSGESDDSITNSTDVSSNSTATNTTNTTNTTVTTPVVPDGYTYISPDDLANNTIAQGALQNGTATLIQRLIATYKLPAASPQYNVTNLLLAAYKKTSIGATYTFYTNMTNALNYKVDANMTVNYRVYDQSFKLNGYSYHTYNYPNGAIVIPPNNTNATNSTNSGNATSNVTAPSNGTVAVPDNSTTANNSSAVNLGNATNNTTSPANNTVQVNQTTLDGYTIMTADQLANDTIAQGALQNGTATLIQRGVSQAKIPTANANYTINNVTLATYKKQTIGTYYKFNVNMTNVDNVHVDANITVIYRYSTQAYSLNGYSYHSYNYSNSALGQPTIDPIIIDDGTGGGMTPIIEDNSTSNSGAR